MLAKQLVSILGTAAAVAGAATSAAATTHRYYKIAVTAAQSDATGVVAQTEIFFAESAGGPQVVTSGMLTGPTAGSGSIGLLVDGDRSAQYSTVSGAFPRNIFIDFGSNPANWKAINELRIVAHASWLPQAFKDFVFSCSDDNVTYTPRITVSGAAAFSAVGLSSVFRTPDCPDTLPGYLYGRFNVTAGNQAAQYALGELEFRGSIGGADLTTATSPVINSTPADGGNPPARAFNNNTASGMFSASGQPYPQWVGVEFDQRQVVAQLSVVPFASFETYAPKDFGYQGSQDMLSWSANLIAATNQTAWAANPTARLFT